MEITPVSASGSGVAAVAAAPDPTLADGFLIRPVRPPVPPFELPPSDKRVSGGTLAALAVLAGIGALALGSLAFVSGIEDGDRAVAPRPGIVGFLSRPSTRRVPLELAAGRIVVAVGSGARAYLLPQGIALAPPGRSYEAWVTEPRARRRAPAAVFTGSELAVPLSQKVVPGSVITVTLERAGGVETPSSQKRFVARTTV